MPSELEMTGQRTSGARRPDAPLFTREQIAALSDAAFVVDRSARIVAWNDAATRLLGWDEGSAREMTCAVALEGRRPDGSRCSADCVHLRAVIPEGVRRLDVLEDERHPTRRRVHPNLRVRRANGTQLDVIVIDIPIELDGSGAVLHLLRPVVF